MRALLFMVISVVLCALQTTLFPLLEVFSVRPNLLIGLLVCTALLRGSVEGGAMGLWCGILMDVTGYGVFGVNALLFLYLGCAVGLTTGRFYKIRPVVAFGFSFAASFAYGVLLYFFAYYIWGSGTMLYAIGYKILPESLYTAVLCVPILLMARFVNRRFEAKGA